MYKDRNTCLLLECKAQVQEQIKNGWEKVEARRIIAIYPTFSCRVEELITAQMLGTRGAVGSANLFGGVALPARDEGRVFCSELIVTPYGVSVFIVSKANAPRQYNPLGTLRITEEAALELLKR